MAAVLAMLLLFLFLWFYYLDAPFVPEEEGIEVAFGDYEEGGAQENIPSEAVPEIVAPAPVPQVAPSNNDLIVQDDEEALALKKKAEEERKRLAEEEALRKKQQQEELARIEAERIAREQAEAEAAAKRQAAQAKAQGDVSKAFARFGNNNNSSGSGTASGNTQQGKPSGSSSDLGISSGGGGLNISLKNRTARKGSILMPKDSANVEGVVVVRICVDAAGKVISATKGQGTDIYNENLINAAIEAAKKVEFNPQEGAQNAYGTITYKFEFKK